MSNLNVRKIIDALAARLRIRSAHAGRSMEAEARDIITSACLPRRGRLKAAGLQEFVDRLYGKRKPRRVVEELIAERRREGQKE